MSNWTQKVNPGDRLRIPAATWNGLLDLLQRREGGGDGGLRWDEPAQILIRNDSGAAVPQYGVLALGDPVIPPADSEPEFTARILFGGTTPAATEDVVAVLLQPAADGAIVEAMLFGLSLVKVEITNAGDTRAAPKAGQAWGLVTGTTGPWEILWKEAGTGTNGGAGYYALVRPAAVTGEGAGLLAVHVSPTPPLHVSTAGGVATVSIDAADSDPDNALAGSTPGYVGTGSQYFGGPKFCTYGTDLAWPYQPGWYADLGNGFVGGVYADSTGGTLGYFHQGSAVLYVEGGGDFSYFAVSHDSTRTAVLDSSAGSMAYGVMRGVLTKRGIDTTRTMQGAGVDAGLRITWEFAGGILVRETVAAGPSGSGSGTATDLDCCPGVALPNTLTMTFPDTTTDTLTFNGGNSWIGNVSGAMVGCYDLGSGIQWYLIYGGLTLPADGGGSCDPFSQTFTDGTDVYEVTE